MGLLDFISKSTTGDGQNNGQTQGDSQSANPVGDVQYPLPQNDASSTPVQDQNIDNYTVNPGNLPSAQEIVTNPITDSQTSNPIPAQNEIQPMNSTFSALGEPEVEDLTKYANPSANNNTQPDIIANQPNTNNLEVDITQQNQTPVQEQPLDVSTNQNPVQEQPLDVSASQNTVNTSDSTNPLIEGVDTSIPQSPAIESGGFPPLQSDQTVQLPTEASAESVDNNLTVGGDVQIGNDSTPATTDQSLSNEDLKNEVINDVTESPSEINQNTESEEKDLIGEDMPAQLLVDENEKVVEDDSLNSSEVAIDENKTESSESTDSTEINSSDEEEDAQEKQNENVIEEKVDESIIEFKKIRNVGFMGLNSNVSNNIDEIGELALKLSNHDLRIYIDSNKNVGKGILETIKDNKGAHITAVHLKPFYSNYSDEDGETPSMSDYTVVVYSDFLEKLKYFIRECEAFVFPNTGGLLNLSALTTLLSFQYLYQGFHKPVILIGADWKSIIDDLKAKNLLSEEDVASIKIAETSEDAINLLKNSEDELLNKSRSKSKKFYDYREDFDEYEYMN